MQRKLSDQLSEKDERSAVGSHVVNEKAIRRFAQFRDHIREQILKQKDAITHYD
jgi:hypothetical protein